jgi:signal transduction histidine kinase
LGIDIEKRTAAARVEGDPLLVKRLVANLLTNAVRHNVIGGRVEVATVAKEGRVLLSVANTGPLIPPGEVDRLFQPFQRLNPRRLQHTDGQGLGLSIVRAIANAHHAELDARPQPGGGLRVTVRFPSHRRHPHAVANGAARAVGR